MANVSKLANLICISQFYLIRDYPSQDNFATVITPDLRGHGRNLKDQPDINYIGQLEEDIEDIIRYAKDSLNARKIILAGHSSGGGHIF